MDYQQPIQNRPKHSNGFFAAALVFGILSIATCCCIYSSIIFGSLGITFALLSRTDEKKFDRNARTGLILSIVGMVLSVVITIGSAIFTIQTYGSFDAFMDAYEETLENYMDSSTN